MEVLPEYLYGSYSGLAVSIFNLVPAVTAGIGMSAIPAIARYCAAKMTGACSDQWNRQWQPQLQLLSPAGLGIFTFAEEILSFLYPISVNGGCHCSANAADDGRSDNSDILCRDL